MAPVAGGLTPAGGALSAPLRGGSGLHLETQDRDRIGQSPQVEFDAEDVGRFGRQAAGGRARVGFGDQLQEFVGVGVTIIEGGEEEGVIARHARFEIGVDVVLVQDAQTVAQADIVRDVARLRIEGLPAFLGRPHVAESAVAEGQRLVFVLHDLLDLGHHLGTLELDEPLVAVGIDRPGIGDGLLVIRAVRGVAVDEQERIPAVEDVLDEPRHLIAFELDRVAVEVEVLAVGPDAHALFRTGLLAAVVGIDLFVAVGVEDGRDEEDEPVEVGRFGLQEDVADHHQGRFFALDFAGVDVGLDINDRFLRRVRPDRRRGNGIPDD